MTVLRLASRVDDEYRGCREFPSRSAGLPGRTRRRLDNARTGIDLYGANGRPWAGREVDAGRFPRPPAANDQRLLSYVPGNERGRCARKEETARCRDRARALAPHARDRSCRSLFCASRNKLSRRSMRPVNVRTPLSYSGSMLTADKESASMRRSRCARLESPANIQFDGLWN